MTRAFALAAALAVAAIPAVAQSAADRQAMIDAIAAAGCRVDSQNNAAVLQAAGLGEDAAAAVVQALLDSGEAVIEAGVLVLKTAGCS